MATAVRRSMMWCALLGATVLVATACGTAEPPPESEVPTQQNPAPETAAETQTTESGLQFIELQVGSGRIAQPGKRISVHYTGWLLDGKKFDSSIDRGQPFEFQLGRGAVISGWDEGVAGMHVGGRRQLIIPPHLGYGPEGSPPSIPPYATLVFEVQLLAVY